MKGEKVSLLYLVSGQGTPPTFSEGDTAGAVSGFGPTAGAGTAGGTTASGVTPDGGGSW